MPSPKCHVPWGRSGSSTSSRIWPWPSPGELVLVVRALGGDRLGVERLAQEVVHRLGLAHAGGRAVGAADRVLGGHVAAAVGLARVLARLPHDLVRDAARVRELQPLGAEALDLPARSMPAVGQPVRPVADRLRRHGDVDRLRLVGPALAHPARLAVREGGEDRARVPHAVRVVEVVDRDLAVEEHGLLDALQAERADVEVVVLLRAADAERQVMAAADRSPGWAPRVSSVVG